MYYWNFNNENNVMTVDNIQLYFFFFTAPVGSDEIILLVQITIMALYL